MSNDDFLHEISRFTTNLGTTNDPTCEPDEPEGEPKTSRTEVVLSSASASSSASSITLPTPATAKERIASLWGRIFSIDYLIQDVQPSRATFPLWCFCFISGFVNCISFTSVLLWCGFQTGNTVQLAVAIGRFILSSKTSYRFEAADQQALISLLSYLAGGYIGRYGDYIGSYRRIWLALGTIMQALLTMAAAITVWKSGEPSVASARGEDAWTNTLSLASLGFASASMGLQGVMARRIPSHFGATVVLTTLWSELISNPDLWRFSYVKSRDHRILAVLAFLLGGIIGRSLLNHASSASVFGIATGLRVLVAFTWLLVPARRA